jgi:AmiR/NasT family two-component response regulator
MDPSPIGIFVVEDMSSEAVFLEAALAAEGYSVVGTAADGPEALRLTRELRPDLIFMDIMLDGPEDGIQVAGRIRAEFGTPLVFLTAYTDAETLGRARAVEPYGYLVKPLEPRLLRPTIEMALHKHEMERERQALTESLQAALAEVEQLRGLLPVCAWCRRVRDDDGYWDTLEGYLSKRLSTEYTHGMCEQCVDKHAKDFSGS